MNIDQWVHCIREAYESSGKAFSAKEREAILQKLPEETLRVGESTRNVIGETIELFTHYFFKKVTLGETFGSIERVKQRFGRSIESNYDVSSGPFIDMAKTYWTYQLELHDLSPAYSNLALARILFQIHGDIASVFFPTPGPAVIWVRQRREMQKKLLEEYAPEIDADIFLNNNPLLGTSKGRVAKTVFNEKVWVRCPNHSCLRFIKIPNTVKQLEIKCPKCKKSFLFPAEEVLWLNRLAPLFHPTPGKVKSLENLRQHLDIPDEDFTMLILSTTWATEQLQRKLFAEMKEMYPKASDKELFKVIIKSRTEESIPFGLDISDKEMEEAVQSMNSLDDLIEFVLSKEKGEPDWPDPFGIGNRIEEILKG